MKARKRKQDVYATFFYMNHQQTLTKIEQGRVIAILRGDFAGREASIVEALISGGITAVEVTMNSPNALQKIAQLAQQFISRCAIGAGTVLTCEEVQQVAGAGGTFIVSPNCDVAVIKEARRLGLASFPGCFTPTEVVQAMQAGADAAKLFPATSLGPGYVKALRAPLNDVKLIPTGGVTPENAVEYLRAGAWAVGIGSELTSKEILADTTFEKLRARAAEFSEAMKS